MLKSQKESAEGLKVRYFEQYFQASLRRQLQRHLKFLPKVYSSKIFLLKKLIASLLKKYEWANRWKGDCVIVEENVKLSQFYFLAKVHFVYLKLILFCQVKAALKRDLATLLRLSLIIEVLKKNVRLLSYPLVLQFFIQNILKVLWLFVLMRIDLLLH